MNDIKWSVGVFMAGHRSGKSCAKVSRFGHEVHVKIEGHLAAERAGASRLPDTSHESSLADDAASIAS